MAYDYRENRKWLASPEGVKAVGEVLRNIENRLRPAGAAAMHKLWPTGAGDGWQKMAAVDHCVALGVIEEIRFAREPWGQHRVFRIPIAADMGPGSTVDAKLTEGDG